MAKVGTGNPKAKAKPKPKLTDAERHKRFVDMAHEVEAEESPEVIRFRFRESRRLEIPLAKPQTAARMR